MSRPYEGGDDGYPYDDDPPRRREMPSGLMQNVRYGQTSSAARIRAEAKRLPNGLTKFQLHTQRRNLVVLLCHEVGLSQKFIADAFSMAKSQIGEILERTWDRIDQAERLEETG